MRKILSAILAFALTTSFGGTALASGKSDKNSKGKDIRVSEVQCAITESDASAIALESAGAQAEQAVGLSCCLDKNTYTVKFVVGQVRYKYKISAADGTVLKEEISKCGEISVEAEITQTEAEEIALEVSGTVREAVKRITAYKEYSCGVPYAYHVEIGVHDAAARQTAVYVYQMDIHTGEVLSSNSYIH